MGGWVARSSPAHGEQRATADDVPAAVLGFRTKNQVRYHARERRDHGNDERLRRGGREPPSPDRRRPGAESILKSNPEQLCYDDLTTALPIRMRSIASQFHSI